MKACVLVVALLVVAAMASELAPASFLEMATEPGGQQQQTPAGGGGGGDVNEVEECEVCVYIIENKEQHQSYLCRSLQERSQQTVCVNVLESLMWWVTNEVYWVNYGCQRNTEAGGTEWVRPCPAHVVCGWLENLETRRPFCNADPQYPKPR